MINTIQRKKISFLFDILDVTGNGQLEPDDFERVANRVSNILGYSQVSKNRLSLQVKSFRLFIQLLTDLGKDEVSINRQEWLTLFDEVLLPNPSLMRKYVHRSAAYIFALFDRNSDRVVSLEEYQDMFRVYNIPDEYSSIAFKKLDENGDGVLQFSEVMHAFYEFFLSDSETANGNWIFGKWDLVEA